MTDTRRYCPVCMCTSRHKSRTTSRRSENGIKPDVQCRPASTRGVELVQSCQNGFGYGDAGASTAGTGRLAIL